MTNKDEKKWLSRISKYAQEHGAFPYNDTFKFDLHHPAGRTFKHNKVHIGSYFVIPVMKEFHDVSSNNPLNVTHYRKRYTAEFGMQRDQFAAMCAVIKSEDGSLPFGDDVYHAVMGSKF